MISEDLYYWPKPESKGRVRDYFKKAMCTKANSNVKSTSSWTFHKIGCTHSVHSEGGLYGREPNIAACIYWELQSRKLVDTFQKVLLESA
jgi:hypothetical protein